MIAPGARRRKPLRASWPAALGWLLACWCGLPVMAQEPAAPSSAAPPSCVDVSVNQQSVLAFDCLSRVLTAGASRPSVPGPAFDAVANEPSNRQVGQYNFSALSHRMGSNLGKSVLPQRPPAVYPPTPAVLLSPGH
ncbi:hypothetical protein DyAD56_15465 [Dyella sp. AD56]|nr:hypothetical protein DyAD56_15465 [Dyella sp. AD56]